MKKTQYTYHCPEKQMSEMGLAVQENVLGKSEKWKRGSMKRYKKFHKAHLTLLKERKKERKLGRKRLRLKSSYKKIWPMRSCLSVKPCVSQKLANRQCTPAILVLAGSSPLEVWLPLKHEDRSRGAVLGFINQLAIHISIQPELYNSYILWCLKQYCKNT